MFFRITTHQVGAKMFSWLCFTGNFVLHAYCFSVAVEQFSVTVLKQSYCKIITFDSNHRNTNDSLNQSELKGKNMQLVPEAHKCMNLVPIGRKLMQLVPSTGKHM